MWNTKRFSKQRDLLRFLNGDLIGAVNLDDGALVDGLTFGIDIGAGVVVTTFAPAKGRAWTLSEIVAEINTTLGVTAAYIEVAPRTPNTQSAVRYLRLVYEPALTVNSAGTANLLLGFSAVADTVQTPVLQVDIVSLDYEYGANFFEWALTYEEGAAVGSGAAEVDIAKVGGTAPPGTGVAGVLPVAGTVARDSADDASYPLKVGGLVKTVPGATVLADGDRAVATFTAEERLHVRGEEVDPVTGSALVSVGNLHVPVGSSVCAVTNGADGTYDYYFCMDGFLDFALQYRLHGGGASAFTGVTMTILATWQDDGTADVSCRYDDVTLVLTGGATVNAAPAAAADGYVVDTDKILRCAKYINIHIVAQSAGGNTADWLVDERRVN